jgi:two-component system nitrogen regulation response regulator GlnG
MVVGEQIDIGNASLHRRTHANGQALNVWLVDDDSSICWLLERALRKEGITPRIFDSAVPVLDALASDGTDPNVILTDIRLPGQSGLDLVRKVHEARPGLPVIVTTAYADLGNAVSAYKSGAFEYLPKPFDIDNAVSLVRRAAASAARANEDGAATPVIPELLGNAPAMQQVFRAIGRLARSSATTVLITGESGTGKELVARALHNHSPRYEGPFVALNTSAIPVDLLEAELFGHERGALTGADTSRPGRFEQAANGTIFLDEIGDMSPALQTRLLRVLAEGEFYRVGGQVSIQSSARIFAATHRHLPDCVKQGTFREDLYHRLNVIQIQVPPLRARVEDIPHLLQHYFGVAALELGIEPKTLSKNALERLLAYRWPGNVRELVNICMRLSVLAPGSEIRLEDLPPEFVTGDAATLLDADWARSLQSWADRAAMIGQRPLLDEAQPRFERALIAAALKRTQGHRREAAELLGWGRNTLTQKIRDLGMGRPEPRDGGTPERTQ